MDIFTKLPRKKIKIEVRTFTAKFCAYFGKIRSFLKNAYFGDEYARDFAYFLSQVTYFPFFFGDEILMMTRFFDSWIDWIDVFGIFSHTEPLKNS